jgi:hypothetical protein
MGFLYFDDSKHPARGFCLGAFVYSALDPTESVRLALSQCGLVAGVDEFKSSARMDRCPEQSDLRDRLREILDHTCRVGVVIVPRESELGQQCYNAL